MRPTTAATRSFSAGSDDWPPTTSRCIAGDIGEPKLGLDDATWDRLAHNVDRIVHPAALVNHVLPYSEEFGPNVVGTAEVIRLAITAQIKPVTYLSTVAVAMSVAASDFVEDGDIRDVSPVRPVDSSYANGYANSKWAGEVLLREAHDLCGLPVAVFRSDMILAHTPIRRTAQRAGRLHAAPAERSGDRHRAGLVLRAGRRRASAAGPLRRAASRLRRRVDRRPWPRSRRTTTGRST